MDLNLPFNKAIWKSAHNSYSGQQRCGILQQLDAGLRLIEFDINFAGPYVVATDFYLGHESPGAEVSYSGGNPQTNNLSAWLDLVTSWSQKNPGHTPIMITLDNKSNFLANPQGHISALNNLLLTHLPGIYKASELTGDWPTVAALCGRILVILSGDGPTRREYGKYPKIMFVEYQQGDNDPLLAKSWFWAQSATADKSFARDGLNSGKIVRLWEFAESNTLDCPGASIPATDTPFSDWYLTHCQRQNACDIVKAGRIPAVPPADFSASVRSDTGVTPSVAVNTAGVAVELHKSQNDDRLWFRVGAVNATDKTVTWGVSQPYVYGKDPSIAINNSGMVVEVHKSDGNDTLWYNVGTVNTASLTIAWGISQQYDAGRDPAIAINNSGTIVEVHKSQNYDTLYYRVGTLQAGLKQVAWGASQYYDTGVTPSVALSDGGLVVEVHKSENQDTLWSHVGTVAAGGIINFSPSQKYDAGVCPGVTVDDKGLAVEVHKSESHDTLWFRLGQIQDGSLTWFDSFNYDTGVTPALALMPGGVAVEVHRSQNDSSLFHHVAHILGNRPSLVSGWRHYVNGGFSSVLSFNPSSLAGTAGSISNSAATFTRSGRMLQLRWPNAGAPGGAWVDSVLLSTDGRSYAGRNQAGATIQGSRQPLVGRWRHCVNGNFNDVLTFTAGDLDVSRGTVVSAQNVTGSFTFDGTTLVMTWPVATAPGGYWIDTVKVNSSDDSYSGSNNANWTIRGTRLADR